jgi:hypothetical protein
MTDIDDRLDEALSRRARDPAAVPQELASYRAALEALERLRDVADRDPQQVAAGRQAFLERVDKGPLPVSAGSEKRRSGWTILWRKERSPMTAIVSLILALALAFGGAGATAYAAQDSLPDQPLYAVKLLGENARLALNSDPQTEFDLLIGFVTERVREMTALAAQGEPVPDQVHLRLHQHLQLALQFAAGLGDQEMMGALQQVRLMAENQMRLLEQVRYNAPEQAGEALRQAEQTMLQARNMAEGGLEDPLLFRHRHEAGNMESPPSQPDMEPGAGDGPPGESPGEGEPGRGPGTPREPQAP